MSVNALWDTNIKNTPYVELRDIGSNVAEHDKKIYERPRKARDQPRPSRVIRVYSMTTSKVDQIRVAIHTKSLKSCKRHIQRQLYTVFQIYPTNIETHGENIELLQTFKRRQPMAIRDTPAPVSSVGYHEPMAIGDVLWNEKHSPILALNNDWTYPFGNITEAELYEKWNSSIKRRRRRLVKLNIAKLKGKTKRTERISSSITTTITTGDPSMMSNMSNEEARQGRRFITFSTESHPVRGDQARIDNRRGPLPKTESCMEDVMSALQDLTMLGSTNIPSPFDAGMWDDSGASIYEPELERPESTDASPKAPLVSQQHILIDHDLALPGRFAYSARPALFGPIHLLTSLRRRAKEQALLSELGLVDMIPTSDYTDARKLRRVDSFGHSILHVAAAAGATPKLLLDLINVGANIHLRNLGGETFLHLLQTISSADCVQLRLLLHKLQQKGFNFSCRDDHGQTPLHNVTRQWFDEPALEGIVECLLSCGITIPTSRDNLGRTVLGQIADVGLKVPAAEKLQVLLLRYDSQPRKIRHTGTLPYNTGPAQISSKSYVSYSRPLAPAATTRNSQSTATNAELLRTIGRAMTSPRYEDREGRNGLHCFAEVSLPPSAPSNPISHISRREAYLSDLLLAKIDPDNCDNSGRTPVMSFIIHTRANEDDESTIRILSCLCAAGANLNRRDRKGRTPLHLAVSLGRTANTRFLVDNGANVHARDSRGKSVIALGARCSENALGLRNMELHARIVECIACVKDAGGVLYPTREQEWARK